jgi:DNA polymerase IV
MKSTSSRSILHVDMDAFYASVEVLDDPSLAGKAVIVGGEGARGVVASCSYEARAFGVRSAMSSIEAKRRCPHAVFVGGRHGRYGEISEQIHAVFADVTPLIEPIALDEAFLDVTGARRRMGSGADIAAHIRATVFEVTGLQCSVGVATSKLIAKLASEAAKPSVETVRGRTPRSAHVAVSERAPNDGRVTVGAVCPSPGVVEVASGDEREFLHAHHARALWGVGPATMERLARFGVNTVGDIAQLPRETLVRAVGKAVGEHLHQLSNAIDERAVEPDRLTKSVGHEETFASDVRELSVMKVEVQRMSDAVGRRLKRAGLAGRTVTVKIKWPDFTMTTRSSTGTRAIDGGSLIADIAQGLLAEPELADRIARHGVRLLGVSVANMATDKPDAKAIVAIAETSPQLSLFDTGPTAAEDRASPPQNARVDDLVAAIRDRFGDNAVAPASLVRDGSVRVRSDQLDNPWDASGSE